MLSQMLGRRRGQGRALRDMSCCASNSRHRSTIVLREHPDRFKAAVVELCAENGRIWVQHETQMALPPTCDMARPVSPRWNRPAASSHALRITIGRLTCHITSVASSQADRRTRWRSSPGQETRLWACGWSACCPAQLRSCAWWQHSAAPMPLRSWSAAATSATTLRAWPTCRC
jgi:hypothetical protein